MISPFEILEHILELRDIRFGVGSTFVCHQQDGSPTSDDVVIHHELATSPTEQTVIPR